MTVVITGAIGSGKSYIAQRFASTGWAYIDADQVGREVLQLEEVIAEVAQLWPHTVRGRAIDRSVLADTVFSDPVSLIRLEEITHQRIRARLNQWIANASGPRIVEVSVLKAIDPRWGLRLVVDAPLPIRLERVIARGLPADRAQQRIGAQPPRAKWLGAADIVIDNSYKTEPGLGPLYEALIR